MSSRYTLMINEEEEYNPTINEDDDSDDSGKKTFTVNA